MKLMIVSTANKFAGSIFSPTGLTMSFFENIPRIAKLTLLPIAPPKDVHEKDNSFSEANATPPTMGARHTLTCHGCLTLRRTAERRVEKKGSAAATSEASRNVRGTE